MKAKSRAAGIVEKYWELMNSNDFSKAAAETFGDDFVLEWPQSGERIRGRENFARVNSEYPAHGPWRFTVNRIVGDDCEAVSDVSVTDGVLNVRAITFSTVKDGRIVRQVEFWPDPYPAQENRKHLVEKM